MSLDTPSRVQRAVHALEPSAREAWRTLVELESPSSNQAGLGRAVDWLSDRLRELGASTERHQPGPDAPGVLVARHPGAGAPMLLAVHLDTVHTQWNGPLWAEQGDRVVGPGVADMKGGVAVVLLALGALRAMGIDLAWTVIATTDEETGSWTSRDSIARLAAGHAAAFVPEPAMSDGSIVAERPGSARVVITAHGRAAHAGRDAAAGVNAVAAVCEAVAAASRLSAPPSRIVNMAILSGGQAANIVPDHARCEGNARWRTDADGETLMEGLRAVARGSAGDRPWVEVDVAVNRPVKERTESVERLARIAIDAARELGLTIGAGFTGGVSDGNIVQSAGVPTLDGMGVRGGNLHRPDEFAIPSSLAERAALLALTMLKTRDTIGA